MQKLILPIDKSLITAGYKNIAYKSRFGFPHYGHDYISILSTRIVRASGDGIVLSAGVDEILGNVIIILYKDVFNKRTAKSANIVARYYHLNLINVEKGAIVSSNTVIGEYGNTGRFSTGAHLHFELDYDTKYYNFSPSTSKSSKIIKMGIADTMSNPADILHLIPKVQACLVSTSHFKGIPYVGSSDLTTKFI